MRCTWRILWSEMGLAPNSKQVGRPCTLAGRGGLVSDTSGGPSDSSTICSPTCYTPHYSRPDIVGRIAGRFTGVPTISSFVTEAYGPEHYGNPEYSPVKVRGAHSVDVLTARLVTRFHAVSASAADVMSSRLLVSRHKIDVIHRGRDPDSIGVRSPQRRSMARKALGIDADTPLILAAGRHYHLKGLDLAVRAMKDVLPTLPQAQLVIAGREGPATPELRAIAERDGTADHLTIAGYRSDIADLMCAADVFVLPSRAEGSPGVLI